MTPVETNCQVLFTAPGQVTLAERPIPTPGPGELLIRTRVSLISPGTERAFFLGLPNTTQTYPQRSGYSNIGEVAAVGDGVDAFRVGDRVASAGNHATYVTVPASAAVPVPPRLEDEDAVFFNLTSIALQGVRKARVELGEPVAVVGAGLIGLLALQLARLQGGLPTVSIDQDEARLAIACQTGADVGFAPGPDLSARLADACGGAGAAVVIEATGHPEAVKTALICARPFGRVVLLGSTRGETDGVNFYRDIHRPGLTVIGAHNIARPRNESHAGWWAEVDDQTVALQLLAHRRVDARPYITHRFAAAQAVEAYAILRAWDRTALGMVLNWNA
jgi:2-desacetyl-2-hydroxyethyl bacteriochlorophyllide A dehydrogenase